MRRRSLLCLALALWIAQGLLLGLQPLLVEQRTLEAAAPAPAGVEYTWITPQRLRLSWSQQSSATQVCLHINAPGYVLLGCRPSAPGPQQVDLLAAGVDQAIAISPGRAVYISEMTARDLLGTYGPYTVPARSYRQLLPLVAR